MSFQPKKCDALLGLKVQDYLEKQGVATPIDSLNIESRDEVKIAIIEDCIAKALQTLGMDLDDDSLQDTPTRVAKMWVNEIYWGLKPEYFPKCTAIENKMNYDEMVVESGVTVQSNCEHHLVVIDGFATIAYIPNKTVLGLSKMNRIVEYFSRRPQVQERLTAQIFHALSFILGTEDVAVVINAQHFCVKSRGVEDPGSNTITSKLGGAFKNESCTRNEFMSLIK